MSPEIRAELRRARPGINVTVFPSFIDIIWKLSLFIVCYQILFHSTSPENNDIDNSSISSLLTGSNDWKVSPEKNIETRFSDVLVNYLILY